MQCQLNLQQLGMAVHNYADAHDRLPAGTVVNTALEPEERLSWVVDLLPYLGQEGLSKRFDREKGWQAQKQVAGSRVRLLLCPSETNFPATGPAITTYVGVAGVGKDPARLPSSSRQAGVFGYDRFLTKFAEVKDGTSNTLLFMETTADLGPWAVGGPATVRGIDPDARPYLGVGRTFGRIHQGAGGRLIAGKPSGNVVMADGSLRCFRESVRPEVFEAAATIAGGE
jgi:hypothetical protein